MILVTSHRISPLSPSRKARRREYTQTSDEAEYALASQHDTREVMRTPTTDKQTRSKDNHDKRSLVASRPGMLRQASRTILEGPYHTHPCQSMAAIVSSVAVVLPAPFALSTPPSWKVHLYGMLLNAHWPIWHLRQLTKPDLTEPVDSHAHTSSLLPSSPIFAFQPICLFVSLSDVLLTLLTLYIKRLGSCFEASTTTCTFPLPRADLVPLSAGTRNHTCSQPCS